MSGQYSRIEREMDMNQTATAVYITIKKQTRLTPQEILDACLDLVTNYCGITPEQWKTINEERDGGLN